eukprot:135333_1
MALDNVELLLATFDPNINVFTSSKVPMSIYNKVWTYLLSDTPIPDNLVLTSILFRDITYHHPLFVSTFHVRLDPTFVLNRLNVSGFQIGSNISEATHKSIILNNVDHITSVTDKSKLTFPFDRMKIFYMTRTSTRVQVVPFVKQFAANIKCMSWNIDHFDTSIGEGKQHETEDCIPVFPQCQLFSISTEGRWSNSLQLQNKFPSLYWFNFALDDSCSKWDKNIFDKLQSFLFSHENTLSILVIVLNLKPITVNDDQYNKDNPFTLVLPKNIELVVLKCLHRERASALRIDFSLCRQKLKQIVLLENAFGYVKTLLLNGFQNAANAASNLEYVVLNDRADVNELTNDLLVQHPTLFANTKVSHLYTPCIPKMQFAHADAFNMKSIPCIDSFPDLECVKEVMENHHVRRLFRNLNCKERRHWLWCIFWFDYNGKGLRNLRELEAQWRRLDMINDDL